MTLGEFAEEYIPFPQVLDGLRVRKKIPICRCGERHESHQRMRRELGESGRVVVRYSGTEPILRIMAEGKTLSWSGLWSSTSSST